MNASSQAKVDIDYLRTWIGKEQERSDYVCPSGAARIEALLDGEQSVFEPGQPISAVRYVMLFTVTEPQSRLGRDGHPLTGGFLPPVPLPRRMFAGRRIDFHANLRIGSRIIRKSVIADVKVKQGASGEMCFVTVRHEFFADGGLVLAEEQDIVYLGEAPAQAAPRRTAPGLGTLPVAQQHKDLLIDPTMLFRYSAITFNAHRIHYDLDYARGVENYPGLVVNGGLTTLLLWDFAMRSTGKRIKTSHSKNKRPLFANSRVRLSLAMDPNARQGLVWASDEDGHTVVQVDIAMEQ